MARRRVASAQSSRRDPRGASLELAKALSAATEGVPIRGVLAYAGVGYDLDALRRALAEHLPGVAISGSTSCLGVGSQRGFSRAPAVTALALAGDDVRFGTALDAKSGPGRALGRRLAQRALDTAGLSPGDATFAVVHGAPGGDSDLLEGICEVLPPETQIIGGGSADDDLSGKWGVFDERVAGSDHVCVSVCSWPAGVASAYESGYMPTEHSAVVTRGDGRTIFELDGRPAIEVYDEWMGGALGSIPPGEHLLAATTLSPLGIVRGEFVGIARYTLVHPERLLRGGAITTFADVPVGERVHMMTTSERALVSRTSRVAGRALRQGRLAAFDVAGALLIYCAGCSLAVQDRADAILEAFGGEIPAPFVAAFTFGEVGSVLPGRYDHANLMASVLLLKR